MNKQKKLVLQIMTALSICAAPVWAAEAPVYDLEEIIVSASNEKSGDITINPDAVSPGQAKTLPELLRQSAGLDVQLRASSGDNQDGTVKLRGHDARRYSVLVDGVPVNMSGVMGGSYMDWNALPLNMVEKIQIIKGAKAAEYGSTLGGVINIITKRNITEGGNIQLTGGSNDKERYLFNYGATEGKLGWSVYGNKMQEDPYLRNNFTKQEQFGAHFRYDISETDQLKFNVSNNKLKRGLVMKNIPGTPGYDPAYPTTPVGDGFSSAKGVAGDGSYSEVRRKSYDLTWSSERDDGSNALTFWRNDEKRHEVQYSSTGTLDFDRTNVSDKSTGWLFTGTADVGKHTYGYGMEQKKLRYGYGWYNNNTIGASRLIPSQKVNTSGVYVEDTWNLDDRWRGNIGLRYDSMTGDKDDASANINKMTHSGVSPKLNFSFKNDERTTTYLSANRIWRAPNMAELYWHNSFAGGTPIGRDRALEPEKGYGYEIGIERQFTPRYNSKLTVYYQDLDQFINFTHTWPFHCYNISDVKLWGVEWENTYKINEFSGLFLNYTNQHTQKDGVAAADFAGLKGELDYRPRHKLAVGYHYDKAGWQYRYDISYVGSQQATRDFPSASQEVVRLGGYTLHNMAVTRDIGNEASINIGIDNLLDKDYVEQYGYPMQGRVYSVTFNQKF